jgi:hypothetical protein
MDALTVGTTLLDATSGVQIVVVRGSAEAAVEFWPTGQVQLGKRYRCSTCDAEFLVTRPGPARLACHGLQMEVAQAKQLPSSD